MFGMNTQAWINDNQWVLYLVPTLVVAAPCAVFYLISRLSGWVLLAGRFRTSEAFYGETWKWQSGRFRGWCGYNNCLTVGASPEALYLSVMLPFRLFHPPLLIPWREIEVETGKALFGFYDTARMRMGCEERVTFRIYGELVKRVRQAAGPGWPLYYLEQMEGQNKG